MSLRRPRERYAGRNGFTDFNKLPAGGLGEKEAIEAQDLARFVMKEMGTPFPSFAEMKRIADAPETLASIKEEIGRVKKEQEKTETQLLLYHGHNLKEDALDLYFATDDLKYFEGDEWKVLYKDIEDFNRWSTRLQVEEFSDIFDHCRYEYAQVLIRLHRRRVELERREEEVRMAKLAVFPSSSNEFRGLKSRMQQLRIARFLMAETTKQEQMMTQSHWAWRQTQPLMQEYNANEEFQKEVQKLVRENESKDPRNRP